MARGNGCSFWTIPRAASYSRGVKPRLVESGRVCVLIAVCLVSCLHGRVGAVPPKVLLIRTHDNVETKVKPTREGWRPLVGGRPLAKGDAFRSDDQGTALMALPNASLMRFGQESDIKISKYTRDLKRNAFKLGLSMKPGWFQAYAGTLSGGGSRVNIKGGNFRVETEAAEFIAVTRQKIVYVHEGDLWIMDDDGAQRKKLVSAPPGRRIGRVVFSPDGTKMVYEAWATGEDRYPETSDLWFANAHGGDARLLLSTGAVSGPEEKAPYDYTGKLLWGPSIDSLSTNVAFYKILSYEHHDLHMRDTHVCTMPLHGGAESTLWTSMDYMGTIDGSQGPFRWNMPYLMGKNTAWAPKDFVTFGRSGQIGVGFSCYVDATDTDEETWPGEFYVLYYAERGNAPVSLSFSVDGREVNAIPLFRGYGDGEYDSYGNWTWWDHPEGAWRSPAMGAWYGPIVMDALAEGTRNIAVIGGDGVTTVTYTNAIDVVKGAHTRWNRAKRFYAWCDSAAACKIVPPSSEAAYLKDKLNLHSAAWSPDGKQLVADFPNTSQRGVNLLKPNGDHVRRLLTAAGNEGGVGNWNVTGDKVVAWAGTDGAGTISVYDLAFDQVTDLGPGEFPVFAPHYHTEVFCFEGSVAVRDRNNDEEKEKACTAGKLVIVDDGKSGGKPQKPQDIEAPYAMQIQPSWGAAVPNVSNLAVTLTFSKPVRTETILERQVWGTTWPGTDAETDAEWAVNWTAYMAEREKAANPNHFDTTVNGAVSQGIGNGTWSPDESVYTFTITEAGFARSDGNWCNLGLNQTGIEGKTNNITLNYGMKETLFRFVDPVGPSGGRVAALTGGRVDIPPGALSTETAIGVNLLGEPPASPPPPTEAGAEQVGPLYAFYPDDVVFDAAAEISLPLHESYLDAAIWYNNGVTWTNLGGSYSAETHRISVTTSNLGMYGVFYGVPGPATLRVSESAEAASCEAGGEVTFSVFVENVGGSGASNTTVTCALPSELLCVATSITHNGVYVSGTDTITWNLGTLDSSAGVWLEFTAVVGTDVTYGAEITNLAVVVSDQTAPTNSNVAELGVALDTPRFGAGGPASDPAGESTGLGISFRRASAAITRTQAEDTNLVEFTAFDVQVQSNQAAGICTYGIVNAVPEGGTWPSARDFAAAFGLYVERYDGDGIADMPALTRPVLQWEIFDSFDPDAPEWTGCTVGMYAVYLLTAHAVAHAEFPGVTILSSAVEGIPAEGETAYIETLAVDYPAALDAIDAVSVHDRWQATRYWLNGSTWIYQYLQTRSFLDTLDDLGLSGRELWMTEADFSDTYLYNKGLGRTLSQDQNAVFLAQSFGFALAAGVDHLFYGEVDYNPAAPEGERWTAMTDAPGNRRKNFYTYRKMIEKLEGCTDSRLHDLGNSNIAAEFTVDGQPLWMVWNGAGFNQATFPVGPVSNVRVTISVPATFNNTTSSWTVTTEPLSNGIASLFVSRVPRYVEPNGVIPPDIDGDGIPNDEDDDMDGDGMLNDYETANDLHPYVDDAGADADGDGMSNGDECAAGTDPRDAGSRLLCRELDSGPAAIEVAWQSVSGRTYTIDWSPNLAGQWSNVVGGPILATGTLAVWYDTGPPRTGPFPADRGRRFYRIRLADGP